MTNLQNIFKDLCLCLGFFTRIPVGNCGFDGDIANKTSPQIEQNYRSDLAQALWAAPLVGFVVAMLAAGVFTLADFFGLSVLISAILALTTSILVTGALHEDGLADIADGFGGGHSIERKLEIMKDSSIGTYGMLALLIVFILRLAALNQLATPMAVALSLLSAHMASRALLPAFLNSLPAARPSGLSANIDRLSNATVFIALGFGILAIGILGMAGAGFSGFLITCLLLGAWFVLMRTLAVSQIKGHTGDVLGALQQGAEAIVLMVASVWLV